jgi:hypothetical protein
MRAHVGRNTDASGRQAKLSSARDVSPRMLLVDWVNFVLPKRGAGRCKVHQSKLSIGHLVFLSRVRSSVENSNARRAVNHGHLKR